MNREEFLKILTVDSKIINNGKLHSMFSRKNFSLLKRTFPEIIEYVNEQTKHIDTDNFTERLALVYYDLKEIPKCKSCGVRLPFKMFKNPYRTFCPSINCHKLKGFNKEQFTETYKANVVDKVNFLNEWLKNPVRFDEEFVEVPPTAITISKIVKNKYFLNLLYDTKELLPLPDYFTDATNLELPRRYYHVINNLYEIPKCSYCDSPARFYNSVKGYSETCEGNLDCERERNRIKRRKTTFSKLKEQLPDIKFLEEYKDRHTNLLVKCSKCGHVFYRNCWNGSHVRTDKICPGCYGERYRSKEENEVCDFLRQNNYDIVCNSKNLIGKGKEIDIYIPSNKLAIEYNGVKWHSEKFGGKNKNYHNIKLDLANKAGIKLLQIQSNEWLYKKEIVQSIILSKLGLYDRKLMARKCKIKEIDTETKNKFLEENHLQGKDKSQYRLGLFHEDELVSVMTFGKRKITKGEVKMELIRFCSLKYTTVIGGASKLLKYFTDKYECGEILTYADRRFSDGSFYEKLGFKLNHISQPNYYYFKYDHKLYHRSYLMKHKMINILENFDENKTEWENAKDNGFDRIWDCGHFVYTLEI